jgi:Na+-translocating ferredoxin:NAD+ oxidoreductase RnfC subunit
MLTIAGAVRSPATLRVPIGATYRDCLEAVGGLTIENPVLCIGGLMMGQTTEDLDTPITKTATGVVILPRTHHVMERKLKPNKVQARIGKSACDQCRYCTEYCPRFLLGYAVEPHHVMRSLAFTATGAAYWNQWASLCCSCGLCTLYSCPEELFPKEACDDAKTEMRRANQKWTGPAAPKVHAMRDGRHVPIKTLTRKLHVEDYDVPAPLYAATLEPSRLILPLKQSAGSACTPTMKAGDLVVAGQVIGEPAANALGAVLHAPFSGGIKEITPQHIVLER